MVDEPVRPNVSGHAWIASLPAAGARGGTSGTDNTRHSYFIEPLHLDRDEGAGPTVTARITHEAAGPVKVDVSKTYYADTPHRAELEKAVRMPGIREAIELACHKAFDEASDQRVEQGGWIVKDDKTGALSYQPYRSTSSTDHIGGLVNDMSRFMLEGKTIQAFFHTHSNLRSDGFDVIQSPDDVRAARVLGVPGIIGTRDGMVYFDGASAPGRQERGFFGPDKAAQVPIEDRVDEAIGRGWLMLRQVVHQLIEGVHQITKRLRHG